VSPALAQREIALAGIALLAAIVALALSSHGNSSGSKNLLQPVTLDGGRWRTSLAGATPGRFGRRTDCGVLLRPATIGVTDSVLPCGIKLYVAYKDSPRILTQVIEQRPVAPGRKFELTPRLAEKLGVDGVRRIRWVYAGKRPR
jgi:hypothetical protein